MTIGAGGAASKFNLALNANSLNFATDTVSQANIVNMTLTNANQEYTIALPTGSRRFTIKLRSNGVLKISYATGTSGSNYLSVFPGCSLTEESLAADLNYVLYVQSPQPGAVVELVAWV